MSNCTHQKDNLLREKSKDHVKSVKLSDWLKDTKQKEDRKDQKQHAAKVPVEIGRIVKAHATKLLAMRQLIAAKKSEMKVMNDYVQLKPGSVDVKSDSSAAEIALLNEQLDQMRGVARAAIGNTKIKTILYTSLSGTSAANTAIALSTPITPSGASEWTSYATLYDEAKVTKVIVHVLCGFTAASSAIPAGGAICYALGYDSTYNTTPTSVVEVLESTQHKLMACQPALTGSVIPQSMHKFEINIPSGPVANATAVTGGTGIVANFPGQWMAVGDASDSVGYLRLYLEAGGASAVMGYRFVVEHHIEFRERT